MSYGVNVSRVGDRFLLLKQRVCGYWNASGVCHRRMIASRVVDGCFSPWSKLGSNVHRIFARLPQAMRKHFVLGTETSFKRCQPPLLQLIALSYMFPSLQGVFPMKWPAT